MQWQNNKENTTTLPGNSECHFCSSTRQICYRYLKLCSVISGLCRASGRLFHNNGLTTLKLHWLIIVRALGNCSKPICVVHSKLYINNKSVFTVYYK